MTTPFPPWAKWIAQDEDGSIRVFEHPPIKRFGGYMRGKLGGLVTLIAKGKPNPHWRNSLDWLG